MEDEPDSVREHPNYMARYQKAVPLTQKRLKVWYPNIIEKCICDDSNATHAWNSFKTSLNKRERNWYRNHLSLCDEQRKTFEDLFDIDL